MNHESTCVSNRDGADPDSCDCGATVTGRKIRNQLFETRAEYAARQAGCRTPGQIEAFLTGARWAMEEVKRYYTLQPTVELTAIAEALGKMGY